MLRTYVVQMILYVRTKEESRFFGQTTYIRHTDVIFIQKVAFAFLSTTTTILLTHLCHAEGIVTKKYCSHYFSGIQFY